MPSSEMLRTVASFVIHHERKACHNTGEADAEVDDLVPCSGAFFEGWVCEGCGLELEYTLKVISISAILEEMKGSRD